MMKQSDELLTSLSLEELEALADCQLAPAAQSRLSDLLDRKREQSLELNEQAELDRLLRQSDQLMVLKTRARYTLNRTGVESRHKPSLKVDIDAAHPRPSSFTEGAYRLASASLVSKECDAETKTDNRAQRPHSNP